MIVVEPSSSRFEAGPSSLSTDEHLLERISAAENRVGRLAERLERSLDLLLRYAQNAYFDRSLMRALVGLLTEDGVVDTERLERMWSERCQRDTVEQEENVHRDELRMRILASANVPDKLAFEELVNEGFLLIEDKQIPQGIGKLRARRRTRSRQHAPSICSSGNTSSVAEKQSRHERISRKPTRRCLMISESRCCWV